MLAFDAAAAAARTIELSKASDIIVADFARIAFAVMQALCIDSTSGCLENVERAWKNIIGSCMTCDIGCGILMELHLQRWWKSTGLFLGARAEMRASPQKQYLLLRLSIYKARGRSGHAA